MRVTSIISRRLLAISTAAALAAVGASVPVQAQTPKTEAKAKPAPANQVPPTFANVPYGDHPRQVLDFYKADSKEPTPLVVYIHGGGWKGGDKRPVGVVKLKALLDQGISVAAINYRYVTMAYEAGIRIPVKWPLDDAARALQFLRSKSGEWNIDKTRIGATGGSAGACSSLWLAMHDDLADPKSADPIARESTRLSCAAVLGAQTSLDARQLREWMPNANYGGHAFGFQKISRDRPGEFEAYLARQDEVLPWIKEYSPYELASSGDAPLFLDYPSQKTPPRIGEKQADPTHSAVMGLTLQEKLRESGVEVHLAYPGHSDPDFANCTEFLIAKLKPARP